MPGGTGTGIDTSLETWDGPAGAWAGWPLQADAVSDRAANAAAILTCPVLMSPHP